jgi:hypothetical protein
MKKVVAVIFIAPEQFRKFSAESICFSYLFHDIRFRESGVVWRKSVTKWFSFFVVLLVGAQLAGAQAGACSKLVLHGQIQAAHEWRQSIGQGWVLRLLPIAGGYTGWDLALDREPAAGYPDALLLATPPYGSISEREIGTSFGLRAQDAIGWNPRSFRFFTDPAAFHEAQQLYPLVVSGARTAEAQRAAARLLELAGHAAAGQLRMDDARLSPGVANPQPFAQAWALRAARMQHTETPSPDGKPTARGTLDWMRFTITLWLPAGWKSAPGIKGISGVCGE